MYDRAQVEIVDFGLNSQLKMKYIIYSLICLGVATFFKILLCAFRETAEAGVGRLQYKYPGLQKLVVAYEKRWWVLTSSLSLSVVICQIGMVVLLCQAHHVSELPISSVLILFTLMTILILFFNEMLPNIVAEVYADRLSAMTLPLVIVLSFCFLIFIIPLRSLGRLIQKYMLMKSDAIDRPTPEDEIMSLMNHSLDMDEHEKEFIRSVFEFDDTDVHEIMTPRVQITAVEDTETIGQCVERIRDIPFSRFPVFHQSLDDICGMVHVKQLMRMLILGREDELVASAASPAMFVPESMKIVELFKLMKLKRTHLVIVIDEYGGTAGVVALEDVIEELIGEIQDESDADAPGVRRLPDGSVIIQARQPVGEVNEMMGIEIPESDQYDSVGGFILSVFNRMPAVGETVEREGFKITVQTATERQIQAVRILKRGVANTDFADEVLAEKRMGG